MISSVAKPDLLLKHTDPAGQGPVSEWGTQLNAYETDIHGNVDSTDRSDDHATPISDRVSQSTAVGTVKIYRWSI
jgi:hypothetical protein